MRIQVFVRLKAGVLDVQGKAVEHGVHGLGHTDVHNVRIGRLIEFDVDAPTITAARPKVEELCQKLFANTVIENFEIKGA